MTKRKPISEEQWLNAREPNSLLGYLEQHQVITRVPGGRRRLALFACGCCRLVWDRIEDERSRRAVEVSERAAEGQASRQELSEAEEEAVAAWKGTQQHFSQVHREGPTGPERWRAGAASSLAHAACNAAARRFSVTSAQAAAMTTATAVLWLTGATEAVGQKAMQELRARQARLVRCLFGNPFRPLPPINPSWLTWNGSAVGKLADSIRAERRFADLPVLADALEEAGCADADILGHCRDDGEHALGCWVIDLLLGKAEAAGG